MALRLCRVTDAFHLIALIQVAVSVGIEPAETFAGNGKGYNQPFRHPADGQKFSQADFIVVVFIGLSDEGFRRVRYVQRIGGSGTATQCKKQIIRFFSLSFLPNGVRHCLRPSEKQVQVFIVNSNENRPYRYWLTQSVFYPGREWPHGYFLFQFAIPCRGFAFRRPPSLFYPQNPRFRDKRPLRRPASGKRRYGITRLPQQFAGFVCGQAHHAGETT